MYMHTENIKQIQIETVKIIAEFEKIINELSKIERNNTDKDNNTAKRLSSDNLTKDINMLQNEKQKLDNLEYVVAVVGTMKSGKSTTINAIAGQEVLPNREFPMTTLPTLITHKPKQKEPILHLKDTEPFLKLAQNIKERISIEKTSEHSDLKKLIDDIKNDKISFKMEYKGSKNIEFFLKQINDLMRVAKDFQIEPPYKDFVNVDDLPRIEVEFYHLSKNKNKNSGRLTLLDTPGPDEFKHSVALKEIFENQLQRASAVMLLVDYTKMNSQSDVEVKQQVKDVAKMIGKQHLFVLLNKFDQRKRAKEEEQVIEEAKDLIYKDVLKDQIDRNNIYPVAAKLAFYANFGLRELEINKKIDTSLEWTDDFGVTLMGEDWEDDIDDIERVYKKCEKTWQKSFFEIALDKIISTIYNDALFLSLKSPLDKLKNLLREYKNVFEARKTAYQTELKELTEIVEALKEDINKVSQISEDIQKGIKKKIENSKLQIEQETEITFESMKKQIDEMLTDSKKEEEKATKDRKNESHKVDNDSFWHRKLWEGGLLDFFKGSSHNSSKSNLDILREQGELKYQNKENAEKVISGLNNMLQTMLNESSKKIEHDINCNILSLSDYINSDIKKNLTGILDVIEKKLSEGDGSLEINLPQLSIDFKLNFQTITSNLIDEESATYTRVGDGMLDRSLNWLNSDWGLEEYKRSIYTITRDSILNNIENTLQQLQKTKVDDLDSKFKEEIAFPIDKKLQFLVKEIEGYREEQIEILTKREKEDKESIEQELQTTKMYQKKLDKIDKRVNISTKILGDNQ